MKNNKKWEVVASSEETYANGTPTNSGFNAFNYRYFNQIYMVSICLRFVCSVQLFWGVLTK